MDMNYYQTWTETTAVYEDMGDKTEIALNYCLAGLAGEVGEALNKWKKILRGDQSLDDDVKEALAYEFGDILWYLARASNEIGYPLSVIARMNIEKLSKRDAENRIQGSGDHR